MFPLFLVPSSRAGSMLTQWYVIAGGIAGLFLVLILLIVFVLIIICLRLRRLQRPSKRKKEWMHNKHA